MKPLPVSGYTEQPPKTVEHVNVNKQREEMLLREIDAMQKAPDVYDPRWLAAARLEFEKAFMMLNRSIFKPQRVSMPEDEGIVDSSDLG